MVWKTSLAFNFHSQKHGHTYQTGNKKRLRKKGYLTGYHETEYFVICDKARWKCLLAYPRYANSLHIQRRQNYKLYYYSSEIHPASGWISRELSSTLPHLKNTGIAHWIVEVVFPHMATSLHFLKQDTYLQLLCHN